jgi:predicted nucleic acid-binding protein
MKSIDARNGFVLDCSVTMAWCFEDEACDYAENVLDSLREGQAFVPALWTLEVANVLLVAERKRRITKVQSAQFKKSLQILPIHIDQYDAMHGLDTIYELARETKLSSYDAAYLALAMRKSVPICSLGKLVIKAAKQLKVDVV